MDFVPVNAEKGILWKKSYSVAGTYVSGNLIKNLFVNKWKLSFALTIGWLHKKMFNKIVYWILTEELQ